MQINANYKHIITSF